MNDEAKTGEKANEGADAHAVCEPEAPFMLARPACAECGLWPQRPGRDVCLFCDQDEGPDDAR